MLLAQISLRVPSVPRKVRIALAHQELSSWWEEPTVLLDSITINWPLMRKLIPSDLTSPQYLHQASTMLCNGPMLSWRLPVGKLLVRLVLLILLLMLERHASVSRPWLPLWLELVLRTPLFLAMVQYSWVPLKKVSREPRPPSQVSPIKTIWSRTSQMVQVRSSAMLPSLVESPIS